VKQLQSLFFAMRRGRLGGGAEQAHHLAGFTPRLAAEVLATLPDLFGGSMEQWSVL
jgi:hypothetical protein